VATEDFTTYTEADPGSDITVTASAITASALDSKDLTSYVYDDKGVDHFDGDFTHTLDFNMGSSSAGGAYLAKWLLGTLIGDVKDYVDASSSCFFTRVFKSEVSPYPSNIAIFERDGGASYNDATYTFSPDTDYYLTVDRDESIGTYGQLRQRVYSDPSRTTLLNTQTLSLHSSKKDFRYIYALSSYDQVNPNKFYYGSVSNLDLESEAAFVFFGNMLNAIESGQVVQTAAGLNGVIIQ